MKLFKVRLTRNAMEGVDERYQTIYVSALDYGRAATCADIWAHEHTFLHKDMALEEVEKPFVEDSR